MTPIAEKIRHDLDVRYQLINRDKLTRWQMARAENKDFGIIDCRGKPIGVGLGCAFDGSVRIVFWQFIKPCIDDTVQDTCDTLDTALATYSPPQRFATLDAVEAQLQGFSNRVYARMVVLDRRMRGAGYPETVAPYDPSREITTSQELIAHRFAILRRHFEADETAGAPSKLKDVVILKLSIFGFGIDLAKGWSWLRNTKAWGWIRRHITVRSGRRR